MDCNAGAIHRPLGRSHEVAREVDLHQAGRGDLVQSSRKPNEWKKKPQPQGNLNTLFR